MWIVSRDAFFARALQIVLARAGLPRAELTSTLPDGVYSPLIVDLDDFERPAARYVVTFASTAEQNADLTRPFLMSEFVTLCQARFAPEQPTASTEAEPPVLRFTEGSVLLRGQPVALSPGEAALLRLLYSHAGECVSKEEIDRLWKGGTGNMTEVYIRYLRQKLDEPSGLRLIRTVRGKGYILCLPNTSR